MSVIQQTRVQAGTPTGGQFAGHNRGEDMIELGLGFGDTIRPVSAAESRAVIENSFGQIDMAWEQETEAAAEHASATDELSLRSAEVSDATAGGTAHAHAEIVAYLISDNDHDFDYESLAEDLLNDRREGTVIEQARGDAWPGPLTALKRQLTVDRFRQRADEMWLQAQASDLPADVQAHFYARFETFSEFSADFSTIGAFGV